MPKKLTKAERIAYLERCIDSLYRSQRRDLELYGDIDGFPSEDEYDRITEAIKVRKQWLAELKAN